MHNELQHIDRIPVGRLLSPGVQRVLSVIRSAGGNPVLVGGCVRDALLGAVSKDIDIEVYGPVHPDLLLSALSEAGKVTEAGKAFGVFKVRTGQTEIDISLPRRDSKSGTGHRGFTVIPDSALGFREASARRDFTVNALMADSETGEIIDCHNGVADLRDGILRHTSAAFADDPLRVLRAVQFTARFGFTLAPETILLCRTLADAYRELSLERIWGEWEKIATRGTHIATALETLRVTGCIVHYPELRAMQNIAQDPRWHPEGDVWTHAGLAADQAARLADEAGITGRERAVLVLAALLHDTGKVTHTQHHFDAASGECRITSHGHAEAGVARARAFLASVSCPEDIRRRVLPLIREHMNVLGEPSKPAVRRLARRLQPASLAQLHVLAGADSKGRGNPDAPNHADRWLVMGTDLEITEKPRAGILTGHMLIAAGMTPGPAFAPVLAAALEAQDAGEFDDEAGAMRWLAQR